MDSMFGDWPWDTTINHLDTISDLFFDLSLPQPSSSCHIEHPLDWDEDLFAQLDDFILFPETTNEGIESFEKPSLPSRYDGESTSQSSPASSFSELVSSPVLVTKDCPTQNDSAQVESAHQPLPRQRRRPNNVFPCTLCKRVCFTSVEARRHHARHVKPFKCEETTVLPLLSQRSSQSRSPVSIPATPASEQPISCGKSFATKNELERHRKSVHYCIPEVGPKEWFKCPIHGCKVAERLWPRRDNLLVHMKQSHPGNVGIELRAFVPEKDGLLLH